MTMIEKGASVHFVFDDGERLFLPPNAAMLHDPDGATWPRHSVLFSTVVRDNLPIEMDADQRDYLGRGYRARLGRVSPLPNRNLAYWKPLGLVDTIYYDRGGTRAPGFFKHAFQAPSPLKGGLIGGALGGFLGYLIGHSVGNDKLVWVGAVVGGLGGAILAKTAFPFDPPASLYSYRGRYWRLELPRLSLQNWRGYVLP
jgi:hypothetical protein